MLKWLKGFILRWHLAWREKTLAGEVADLRRIEEDLRAAPKTYTTIKSFYGHDADFWRWAKEVMVSDEYRYLIFSLRENIIREMVALSDPSKLIECNGRLNMLQILDRYINVGLKEYEDKLQRASQDAAGRAVS